MESIDHKEMEPKAQYIFSSTGNGIDGEESKDSMAVESLEKGLMQYG